MADMPALPPPQDAGNIASVLLSLLTALCALAFACLRIAIALLTVAVDAFAPARAMAPAPAPPPYPGPPALPHTDDDDNDVAGLPTPPPVYVTPFVDMGVQETAPLAFGTQGPWYVVFRGSAVGIFRSW